MAKYSGADAFYFKPFPGIPWPEWDVPVEIDLAPRPFPGIIDPYFEKLEAAKVSEVRELDNLSEIEVMMDMGLF